MAKNETKELPIFEKFDPFGEDEDDLPITEKNDLVLAFYKEGLSIAALAKLFERPITEVQQKLATAPHLKKKAGGKVYDIKVAAPHLCLPLETIEEFLTYAKPRQIPENFRDTFWKGRHTQYEFAQLTNNLWHTEDVVNSFTALFAELKEHFQVWPSQMKKAGAITDTGVDAFIAGADDLQEKLYNVIMQHCKTHATPSALARFETDTGYKVNTEYDDIFG